MGAFNTLTNTVKRFLNGKEPGSPFVHDKAEIVGDYLDNLHPSSWFASGEETGTGSSQDVAHGLGRTPGLVIVTVTNNNSGVADIAEGAHDDTNVKVTVTAGATFKVYAL